MAAGANVLLAVQDGLLVEYDMHMRAPLGLVAFLEGEEGDGATGVVGRGRGDNGRGEEGTRSPGRVTVGGACDGGVNGVVGCCCNGQCFWIWDHTN